VAIRKLTFSYHLHILTISPISPTLQLEKCLYNHLLYEDISGLEQSEKPEIVKEMRCFRFALLDDFSDFTNASIGEMSLIDHLLYEDISGLEQSVKPEIVKEMRCFRFALLDDFSNFTNASIGEISLLSTCL